MSLKNKILLTLKQDDKKADYHTLDEIISEPNILESLGLSFADLVSDVVNEDESNHAISQLHKALGELLDESKIQYKWREIGVSNNILEYKVKL